MTITTTDGEIPESVPIILVNEKGAQIECAIVNENPEFYLVKPLIDSEFSRTAGAFSNLAFARALWRVSKSEAFVQTERSFDIRQLSDRQQIGLARYLHSRG